MKIICAILLSTLTIILSPAAFASDIECRVSSVDESANVWEEGLGIYGDPDADDDSDTVAIRRSGTRVRSVSVGQMRWAREKGDRLTISTRTNKRTIRVSPKDGLDEQLMIIIHPSLRGVVLWQEEGAKYRRVASIDCSSLDILDQAFINDANVDQLSDEEFDTLPQAIRQEMSKTDIAFELGDGYYDLQESIKYVVKDDSGNVAGYLEHARLTYTEGEDAEVLVKYDRNGLRHGETEVLN